MPEKAFNKIRERIKPEWKVCFFAVLIAGFFAHFYKMVNWLPNWDSLVFRYDSQNMVALGRWFLPVVCSVSSFYDLPFLNSVIAILFYGLGAVCICRILRVKKSVTAFLIGALVVTFPTVTSVFMYGYVADGYSIAFFLSCVAAECLTKNKLSRFLAASVLIALSSGIYQAYVTVTIMLVLIHLTDEIIYQNRDVSFVVKKGMKIFLSGLFGMLLYYGVMKLTLSVFNTSLLDYQGLSSAVTGSGIDLYGSLYKVKETFVDFFFDFSKGVNLFLSLNVIIALFTAFWHLWYAYKNKVLKSPAKVLLIAVLGALFVLGSGALAFVNGGIDYHNLMVMSYCVFYVLFIILYERGADKEKISAVKCWSILLIGALLIFNNTVIANVSYHKAQMAYEKSYAVMIRIADRIEQTPHTAECDEILVVGALENSRAYSVNLPPDITGITDGYIIRADDETVGQSVFCSVLNDYCGKEYRFVSGERKKAFLKTAAVKNMGKWPLEDCVTVMDNVIVIKLGAESE